MPQVMPVGRQISAGLMRRAGFSNIRIQVVTRPDTDGRLLPMIRNMAEYAQAGAESNKADIERMVLTIEQAISQGSYLALAPQFVVSAVR